MPIVPIRNKLEVLPGGVIRIPGCEPVSAFSSRRLSEELHCNASVISVEKALEVVPGSTLERWQGPVGIPATGLFFVLPDGPPPSGMKCPCIRTEDWYQVLRDNAEPITPEEDGDGDFNERVGFYYSQCVTIQDHMPIDLEGNLP